MKKIWVVGIFLTLFFLGSHAQVSVDTMKAPVDTIRIPALLPEDTTLRIRNLNPYISLHVDSLLSYPLEINKDQARFYWYLKNAPVGLRIGKDNGLLSFKAEKAYFLSGRLKYDFEYKVTLGVQNLDNPKEKVDTSFTLVFFSTEIIPSRVKPSVNNTLLVDEGDSIRFTIQCDEGNFPIEEITYTTNYPIKALSTIRKCGDEFNWAVPYDFIKEGDTAKTRSLYVNFIGANKFNNRDTAVVRIIVRDNINYPQRVLEYLTLRKEVENYSMQLKGNFMMLDKNVKSTKNTRTTFDMTSAATALGGTVFSSMEGEAAKNAGKILPSVGVALVPVKETVAPSKVYEQNSAGLIRNSIKRLDFTLSDNSLVGDKDPDILNKTKRVRDELKQVQMQLIDVPLVDFEASPEELDQYFNSPKVKKKYRLKK